MYIILALDSPFSRPVFQTLIEAEHPPAALILPNPDRAAPLAPLHPHPPTPLHSSLPFPLISPAPSLSTLASLHTIPLFTLGNLRHPDALAALRAYEPDFLITACFPRLLPPEMLAIPRIACLNLHPSLLPAYRGPEPLFWQFYYGETHTGVTLHWMDENADTGDLLAQAEVPFPDGISLSDAETLTARAGGELLCRALSHPEQLPRTPQPQQGASYHPRPTSDALVIPTTWPARRAYNFLRAARAWGPFEITHHGSGKRLRVREAVAFESGAGAVTPRQTGEGGVWVQFTDGVVYVRV